MSSIHHEGYLALPAAGKGKPVLVLHAWWGLNATIRGVCDRLAEAGFVAFAPDLYHGQVTDTIAGAEALGRGLDANFHQARAEVAAAARLLADRYGQLDGKIAVVGFSLGAFYALDLSNAQPELIRSVVVFYGTGAEEFGNSSAEYLGHFASDDEYEPQANIDNLEALLKEAGRPVTIYQYPGTGHWFFEPDRVDAYNQAAADLAWARTLAFLQR